MKIRTESHGSFPTMADLPKDKARIAFFNSDRTGSLLKGEEPHDRLLVLGVDDLDVQAIPAWIRGLLVLPQGLSYRVKRFALNQAISRGEQPSAPMAVGDAHRVLEFVNRLQKEGAGELVISCEYGKSRSVTLARFLDQHLFEREVMSEKVPNAWIDYLMKLALKNRATVPG
jgi:hypothetical protein